MSSFFERNTLFRNYHPSQPEDQISPCPALKPKAFKIQPPLPLKTRDHGWRHEPRAAIYSGFKKHLYTIRYAPFVQNITKEPKFPDQIRKKKVILVNSQKTQIKKKNTNSTRLDSTEKNMSRWPTVTGLSLDLNISHCRSLSLLRASCSKSFMEVISANTAIRCWIQFKTKGDRKQAMLFAYMLLELVIFGPSSFAGYFLVANKMIYDLPLWQGHSKWKTVATPWGVSIPEGLQPRDQEMIFGQIRMGCQA